ncbi:maguk p55 subfamily member 4 [Limosa lapponica baueri]|uniref:Maguk p55 subfamily member 4 n=1 Tax=Limosa lapponica baueri TaxID=1758121 RepID=A0A2I0UQH4_LIMLA|nr:maguk p55 subfamily member 4 [Limosa lapponica baueri]
MILKSVSTKGVSHVLTLVLQELSLLCKRDVNGVGMLYDLLRSRWLQALLKALLSAHDTVAQKDFEPTLPPLPDNIPENEEAMRIVCLVKNNQPLGATIKRHEITGDITVARVIHGGLADRSGLLYAGDKLVEVNGVPVEGLEPEQVINILVYVRAMADYWPLQDPAIPCADAGLPFKKGDILQIVDQNDAFWWQARKVSDLSACAGLIPSNHLLKRKQREFWWSQPFQPHLCLKSSLSGFRRSMRLCRRKSRTNQQACYARCPSSCYNTLAAPYEEVVRYQRHPADRNRLIILVGPAGVGVNELRRRLIASNPREFQSAVPHTTRVQKSYEMNGREYHYVSKETFENMVYSHKMLEYGEYKGYLYGTSIDAVRTVLDEGKICVIDLEPQEEDLQEMEDSAKKIEAQFGQFFDQVIVNDNLQEASAQLLSAVHRAQDEPQWVPAIWICSDTQP